MCAPRSSSNTESSFVGDNGGPLDYYNLKLEKTPATFDRPHMFKGFVSTSSRSAKARPSRSASNVLNAIVGGWDGLGILNYYSGGPLGSAAPPLRLPNGWNGGQRPNVAAGDCKPRLRPEHFNFANTAAAAIPISTRPCSPIRRPSCSGRRRPLRPDPRLRHESEDAGLLKNFRIQGADAHAVSRGVPEYV